MDTGQGVAIVGMGCRFPGGVFAPDQYWDFMLRRGDGIVEVPRERWNIDLFYDPDPAAPGRAYTRRGGFVTRSPWDFDAEFFGISPREAEVMDPQQSWLLEVAWEALDDAGLAGVAPGRDVGVYIGGFMCDNQVRRAMPSARRAISHFTATGGSQAMLSNRLSHALDLRGPSMTIDTACSSSLVAIHEATQAISRGECEFALAGGVSVMLHPEVFVSMCKGKFLARDGRSKAFDAAADGYGRGEGAGMLVLKSVEAALRDRDRIYAVIAGSGVNQDGRTLGITVPNRVAQRDLAQAVCAKANLAPHEIGYVEAHGTGTPVGDPIEVTALSEAYGLAEQRTGALLVGSVKPSIGHLEAAAGVAGVIKAALAIRHRTIPAQGWLENLNPAIPFDDLNIEVVTQTTAFPTPSGRAIAAVNGFGYGGTNGHVILAQAPDVPATAAERPSITLFPISGANKDAVCAVAAAMRSTVDSAASIDDLCSAAWSRRAHHTFRTALPCSDKDELARHLDAVVAGTATISRATVPTGTKPVFVFSGMGPQWWGMARELLDMDGPFARAAAEVDALFVEIAGWSIRDELLKPESDSRIQRTEYAQPANFLVQVGIVAELAALGVEPAAIVGHSVGEVSAAFVSGALTLRDALLVSYQRARLQASTEGSGGMLAVGLPESEVALRLSERGVRDVVVAAVNGPDAVTLAGPLTAIEHLHHELSTDAFVRRLQVTVPYHSPLMDPILDDLVKVLAGIQPLRPHRDLYSTVTAQQATLPEWGPEYWCANVRRPVRFGDTIETLIDAGHRVFLEVGPHPVLSGNIRAILAAKAESGVAIATLKRGEGDHDRLLGAVGELYRAGCLGRTAPGQSTLAPHLDLPSYPWQHKVLFAESRQAELERNGGADDRPLLGTRATGHPMAWSTELSVSRLPWLPDHLVDGKVVLPGTAYLDAFLCAAAECTKHRSLTVESVRFSRLLLIDDHAVPTITVTAEPATMRLSFSSCDDTDSRIVHSTARIVDAAVAPRQVEVPSFDGDILSHEEFYALLKSRGFQYGPAFRRVVEARVGSDVIVTTVDPVAGDDLHLAHPAVVDAALQGVAAFDDLSLGTMVPVAVDTVRRHGPTPTTPVTAVIRRGTGPDVYADIAMCGPDGTAFFELLGVRFAELTPSPSPLAELGPLLYEIDWCPVDPAAIGVRVDQPVLQVALGSQAAEPQAPPPDCAALIQPMYLAHTIRQLEGADVTVVVVAGDDDVVSLVAELVEVAVQFDSVIDSNPDVRIDAILLTTGAFRLRGDHQEPNVRQAALAGARRVLQNEQLSVRWRHIDLQPGADLRGLDAALLSEIHDGEQLVDEIAVRDGVPFAPHYRRDLAKRLDVYSEATPHIDPEASFVLEPPRTRLLDDLALRAVPRITPGARQIEVRLNAIGLNYKDAMKLLGVLTPQDLRGTAFGMAVGMEGIGVVTRAGSLSRFEIGDVVMVAVPNMFSRYLTLDPAHAVVERLTRDLTPGLAASFIPYLTAHYGLVCAARLGEDDTILVHGAAGGTGLAAVHLARHLGARVIASAGTEERRAFARAAGAHHTVNSRTVNFVDDVMRLTDGHGADVIYTSLPGEALRQNLRAAAEFGRIVDIGKADIYGNRAIELGPFDRNLQYFAIDVDRMLNHRPAFTQQLATEVIMRLDNGTYPPLPATTYDAGALAEAFNVVARGTQQGRVEVHLGGNPPVRPAIPSFPVRSDGSYLVTGAFGAVGLALVDWLVDQGARHLVVVSRSGPRTGRAKRRLRAWRASGADIRVEAVDIGDGLAVSKLIARATEQMPPLRGVFHAAGVAEDSAYGKATPESLRRVIAPKLDGAWNLHCATETAGIELDAFVLFSSTSAIIGAPFQLAYAAANAGLDAIAQLRRARGAAGLSVNWGALRGGGMLDASSPEVRRVYREVLGQNDLLVSHVPALLATVLAAIPSDNKLSNVVIADIDWQTLLSGQPALKSSTRFADFAAALSDSARNFRAELFALPPDQRLEMLTSTLAEQVAAVLGIPTETIDHHTALAELGLDSLSSVEIASRVAANLDIRISAVEFERLPGLSAIAKQALAVAEVS
ncbi:type I polyketide synthase [Mycobacterium bourgelatii]|uniref:Putative polyketide synthase n=1 Tax=Mycobacterium bourgelatii TaxID=1273442 RepID=A0A7I9YMF3_MYCBU|nr:type I polyketide synthase [Mycobacterium bourgelatii]MCV6977719.1 SDR family NAD(P)-dependent oxidoreductase [Mycobacterium bourgelatii]GFG89807.1 putative polyketide synthase [Mycobacterium bourgelatii]